MMFAGRQTCVLVAGLYWRILANMVETNRARGQGWAVQKQLNRSRCRLGYTLVGPTNHKPTEHVLDGVVH